ncbi:MAG: alpha/beta hydrolase [Clostridia bacterium]|nr:alpha/beta hydrolase [Clostridia bacterium]
MLLRQDFYFHALHANRPLHIYLPDWGEGPYPCMYFLDGQNLFRDSDATYGKSWGLEAYLDRWDKPMVIVGLECGHGEGERLAEYLPYDSPYGWLRGVPARGEDTLNAILHELKPYIDRTFPVIPFRDCTGIGGSSMGGLMATWMVVRANQYFSKAACVSPSLGTVSGKLWHDMNETALSPDTRAFFSWGTMEGYGKIKDPTREDRESWLYRTCRVTADKIERAGGQTQLYCQVGGRHCEEDWEKQLPLIMPFLWQR